MCVSMSLSMSMCVGMLCTCVCVRACMCKFSFVLSFPALSSLSLFYFSQSSFSVSVREDATRGSLLPRSMCFTLRHLRISSGSQMRDCAHYEHKAKVQEGENSSGSPQEEAFRSIIELILNITLIHLIADNISQFER